MIYNHHIIFEEINYDIEALTELYIKMRHCALEWNEWKTAIAADKNLTHKRQKLVDGFDGRLLAVYAPAFEGKEMIDYPQIQNFVNKFNFLKPLGKADISFQINEPGYEFRKHTDRNLDYTMMCPLLPRENLITLSFGRAQMQKGTLQTKNFMN